MIRVHYKKKLFENSYGTVNYDLNFDKDTGIMDVIAENWFYFAGFWSFRPGVGLNLSDDIVGGVQRMGNFCYASSMTRSRYLNTV